MSISSRKSECYTAIFLQQTVDKEYYGKVDILFKAGLKIITEWVFLLNFEGNKNK